MSQLTNIEYHELADTLAELHPDLAPAEMQGVALAFLCLEDEKAAKIHWAEFIFDEFHEPLEQEALKSKVLGFSELVFKDCDKALHSPDMSVHLCLPDDDQPLDERVEALSAWCRGFMFGLGMAGHPESLKDEEIQEALGDLSKMTDLTMDKDAPQEDEDAYIELVEYARIIPIMIQQHVLDNKPQAVTVH